MCDGEALRYQSRRMIVRTKRVQSLHQAGWYRRKVNVLSQHLCWGGFFISQEVQKMFIFSKRWRLQ